MSSRGRRLYDWWSRHPTALRVLYGVVFFGRERRFRQRSVQRLDLSPGDRVIELGCGRGNSLARLREAVGPDGTVIGVDYSSGMTRAASERVERAGWDNVHVVRADAGTLPVAPDSVDAAYAAMSLTAMPDAAGVTRAASEAIRPGGRFGLLDARPFQHWPWQLLNPIVVPVSKALTDWHPETDPIDALAVSFDEVRVTTDTGGAIVLAHARLAPE